MIGPSTRPSKPGLPVRPLNEKDLGTFELSTSNPRTEVPEAPSVSARGADDVDIGDEVAQRGVNDAEAIEGDEVREPRRPNSPSDPMSREIEDHVLTGHASFRSWCAACVQGRGRAERHQGQGRKELEDGSKVPVVSWDYCFFGSRNRISEAEVEQRGDSPVLVKHDGVTKSIFAHLIPAKGVDFPCCEKVVKMIVKDLDPLGYHRVVFRCDNEPSILALLRAVKLAWTGDVVVQETSAEGDPSIQRCCSKFSNCRQSACQIDQAGGAVSFGCGGASRPKSVDVACVECHQHASSVFSGSRRQDSIRKKCGKARCSTLGTVL